jgi:hypothetical protein
MRRRKGGGDGDKDTRPQLSVLHQTLEFEPRAGLRKRSDRRSDGVTARSLGNPRKTQSDTNIHRARSKGDGFERDYPWSTPDSFKARRVAFTVERARNPVLSILAFFGILLSTLVIVARCLGFGPFFLVSSVTLLLLLALISLQGVIIKGESRHDEDANTTAKHL